MFQNLNISPQQAQYLLQLLAAQSRRSVYGGGGYGGYPTTSRVAGGYPDLVGAEVIGADYVDIAGADPDADALMSGLDVAQISGAEVIGAEDFDDVAGYDVDEIGAARPRRFVVPARGKAGRVAAAAALARRVQNQEMARQARIQRAMAAQPVIVDKDYKTTRTVPLGIDSQTDVPAGSQVIIPIIPNGPYKVRFLLIPDDVAPDFSITSMFFGRVNGLGGAQEVPATTYAESADAKQNEFDVPMMIPGIPIQLGVRNKAGVPRRFQARFQGQVFENT